MTKVLDQKTGHGTHKTLSLLHKGWLSLVLFIFAGASLALGAYYQSRPAWADRPDISEYNAGVAAYYMLPASQLDAAGTPQTHFARARAETSDRKLLSLSAYNLGTILGIDAAKTLFADTTQPLADTSGMARVDNTGPADAQVKLGQAVAQLADAIRNDPSNEDAKFNLELLRKLLSNSSGQAGDSSSHGYSPGQSDKGF